MYNDDALLRHLVVLNPIDFLVAPATKLICQRGIHRSDEDRRLHTHDAARWMLLRDRAILDPVALNYLWPNMRDRVEDVLRLMVNFGLVIPIADGVCRRFLVPALLPSDESLKPLAGYNLTCFMLFAEELIMEEWKEHESVTMQHINTHGFFPEGVFPRLLGHLITVTQRAGAPPELMSCHRSRAQLRLGDHEFALTALKSPACVRLDLRSQNPVVIIESLADAATSALSQCMKRLRSCFVVPAESAGVFAATPDTLHGEAEFVMLEGRRGLRQMREVPRGFELWVPPKGLLDEYHVFISYRWGAIDSDMALQLFYGLGRKVDKNGRRVEAFLDRQRLYLGRDFQLEFMQAICTSRVVVPIVSGSALSRMRNLTEEGGGDNVLLEWTLALELAAAGRVSIVPLLYDNWNGQAFTTLFPRPPETGPLSAMPNVVNRHTVDTARRFLNSRGIPCTASLGRRTVCETVEAVCKFNGVVGWELDVSSQTVSDPDAALASSAHADLLLHSTMSREVVLKIMESVVISDDVPPARSMEAVSSQHIPGEGSRETDNRIRELELRLSIALAEKATAEAERDKAMAERDRLMAERAPPLH